MLTAFLHYNVLLLGAQYTRSSCSCWWRGFLLRLFGRLGLRFGLLREEQVHELLLLEGPAA